MQLKDQIALVTGASRGIGQAIAIELGRQGAFVIGTATGDAGLECIQKALQDNALEGLALGLDVTSSDSMQTLVDTLSEKSLTPSIVVNNAGITRDTLVLRMKDEDWDAVIDTNLSAVFRLCKTFMRGMIRARYGRIVNITSVVGLSGNAGQTNYSAAKAGLIGFTKSLAREVGTRGITVNAVAPGFIDTDMTRGFNDQQRQGLLDQIPLNRLGEADEVAAAVAFLVSSSAGYITGETLNVNGGMYMA